MNMQSSVAVTLALLLPLFTVPRSAAAGGQSQKTDSFEVTLIRIGTAAITPPPKQFEGAQLTGTLLEIRSLRPDGGVSFKPQSVLASVAGNVVPATVVFDSGSDGVVDSSIAFEGRSTIRNWGITINNDSARVNRFGTTTTPFLMTLEDGGSHPTYKTGNAGGVIRVGFIFVERPENIASITLLGMTLDIKPKQ